MAASPDLERIQVLLRREWPAIRAALPAILRRMAVAVCLQSVVRLVRGKGVSRASITASAVRSLLLSAVLFAGERFFTGTFDVPDEDLA